MQYILSTVKKIFTASLFEVRQHVTMLIFLNRVLNLNLFIFITLHNVTFFVCRKGKFYSNYIYIYTILSDLCFYRYHSII